MEIRSDYHELVRRDVLPLVPAQAGRVLDFGGGLGATSAALKAEGRATSTVLLDQVAGVPRTGIDACAAVNFDDHDALRQALGNAAPFDTILALDVLEHLKDPWGTVALLDQVLVPGGTLIVSVPNVNSFDIVLPLVMRGQFEYRDAGILDRTHLRWFSRRSAIALAASSGLEVADVRAMIGRRRDRKLNAVTFGALERFFAMQYVIIARKAGIARQTP
jgi:2-polyprenyl-3-methyl-5-hydroxy-6-metoxy-1,4-benzoquinol methylase